VPRQDAYRLLLLGALCALPPLSIDMALPSLPATGAALGVSSARMVLTVTVFMVGFALTPIVYGMLSDRHGRRPLLIGGLSLFALGGVGCLFAPTFALLLLARLAQGMGAGCGPTLAFAAIRDRLTGPRLGRQLATMTMLLNTAPVIAPSLGTVCLALGGWQGVYLVLASGGVFLQLAAFIAFEESRSPRAAERAGQNVTRSSDTARLLRQPPVLLPGLVYAFSAGSMFAYVSTSPLLLMQMLGASPRLYAGLFALTGAGIVLGAFVSGRALRTPVSSMVATLGLGLSLVGPACAAALLATASPGPSLVVGCMAVATFGYGLVAPVVAQATLDPVPGSAGTASALMNSVQMVCMAASSLCASLLFPSLGALAPSITMGGFASISAACFLAWRRINTGRHDRRQGCQTMEVSATPP
jgi:MFS transporter, DHA1 family, multidrug resistance protein